MTSVREISQGIQTQGADEEVIYELDVTNWGNTPTSPSVAVYDVTNGTYTDVTTTVMPTNSPSVTNNVITLSPLKLLTAGKVYRVDVKFTISGSVLEAYAIIKAER